MKTLQDLYHKLVDGAHWLDKVPAEFLAPISQDAPCGPSLEYDNEYAVLRARLEPRADVQYGDFTSKVEAPIWTEIERDCRHLLSRSKDISLLIWYLRSRTRSAGADGLAQGLAALQAVLRQFEQEVHPQLMIEGAMDPAVRANALAALCDPDGLMGDIRDIVVSSNTAARLTVRDVERALSIPRLSTAMEPEAVKRQLSDLFARKGKNLKALLSAGMCLQDIAIWAHGNLGNEAPDLRPLQNLLASLTAFAQQDREVAQEAQESHDIADDEVLLETLPKVPNETTDPNTAAEATPNAAFQASPTPAATVHDTDNPPNTAMNLEQQRAHIRQLLGQVRVWIEHNEPSSPVSVLLKQAERLWGKRFSQVAHVIPPDLLQLWDQD